MDLKRTKNIDHSPALTPRMDTCHIEGANSSFDEWMQKAVQNEQILRRYQRFELKLLDAVGLDTLLDLLLKSSIEYFQLDGMELWLYDPQHTVAEHISSPEDYPNLHISTSASELSQFYKGAPSVQLVSLVEPYKGNIFSAQGLSSAALLPLVRHGVLVGSLHMGAMADQRFAADKSTDFINHLASVVAVCFENVVNQERLHRLTLYDTLTKVKNRRAFQQALAEEVSRASRSGDLLSLLFVDLDHFKQVNDKYGHQTGDRVLRVVAQYIDQMLRKTDHVYRYGGEEFALILPNCTSERATEVAERIRLQISKLMIANGAGGELSLTLSIGISCWQPDVNSSEQTVAERLVGCADQGVYRSKNEGRNTTYFVSYSE